MLSSARRFFVEQDGLTTTEYAIVLSLLIIVAAGTLQMLGRNVTDVFATLNAHTSDGTSVDVDMNGVHS